MNISCLFKQMLSKFHYLPEQTKYPYKKAVLYFLLIPSLIISLKNEFYSPILLTIISIVIGYKDIRIFIDLKKYKFIRILRLSGMLLFISLFFMIFTLKIMSYFNINVVHETQIMTFTENNEHFSRWINLPFIVIGEEFFKFLIFISFFILLSPFPGSIRIFISVVLASFIFSNMHINENGLSAIPLMMGTIPTFYFMLYYKSILPLIIEHLFLNVYSFSFATKYQDIFLISFIVWIMKIMKDSFIENIHDTDRQ